MLVRMILQSLGIYVQLLNVGTSGHLVAVLDKIAVLSLRLLQIRLARKLEFTLDILDSYDFDLSLCKSCVIRIYFAAYSEPLFARSCYFGHRPLQTRQFLDFASRSNFRHRHPSLFDLTRRTD